MMFPSPSLVYVVVVRQGSVEHVRPDVAPSAKNSQQERQAKEMSAGPDQPLVCGLLPASSSSTGESPKMNPSSSPSSPKSAEVAESIERPCAEAAKLIMALPHKPREGHHAASWRRGDAAPLMPARARKH